MKKLIIACCIACTPVACNLPPLNSDQIIEASLQQLIEAERAYTAGARITLNLLNNGTLQGDAARVARKANNAAITALIVGKIAYDAVGVVNEQLNALHSDNLRLSDEVDAAADAAEKST